ncbi:MAG: SMP-30/gluconolactonase/LRE family protein [Planctomycetales bacterium]|nr:SMP-30/gluconolactonase/LRE family protein [Planctomycetales bacterium]
MNGFLTAELVLDAAAELGEGALWDVARQKLWWVDIEPGQLHCFDPATGSDQTYQINQRVGTVVVRERGGLVLAVEQGFAAYDLDTQKLTVIHDPETHLPGNRFNDGKCDPAGRFWAGTMDMSSQRRPSGALYRLDTDGTVTRQVDNVRVSNGIVWTSDARTMYYIDSHTRRIDAFDYDNDSGRISNRRPVVEVPPDRGKPDGMAIDAEDNLWVAHWGGWCVSAYDPQTGQTLAQIEVPAKQVTSCAFGGAELDQLFITTARIGQDKVALQDQPHAGGLFLARPGVRGTPSASYAG